jgi:transcriptional regulatory protein GAL4
MPFADQLFNDPTFGSIFPDVNQDLNVNAGMDFSEWVNFAPTPHNEFT